MSTPQPPRLPPCGAFHLPLRPAHLYPWLATCAGQGPVFVLDGGQRFNAYQVARAIRQQTVQLASWQANVQIARAFTCHEMTTLLAHTPVSTAPLFILDLLATFADDAVSDAEAHWLLGRCLTRIHHLSQTAPVLVLFPSRPPPPTAPTGATPHARAHPPAPGDLHGQNHPYRLRLNP